MKRDLWSMTQDSQWYTCYLGLRTGRRYSQACYHQSYKRLDTGILGSAVVNTSHILLHNLHISYPDSRRGMIWWAQGSLVVALRNLAEEVR